MKTVKIRLLGATEKLFWLLDQTSQVHFVMAAELRGHIEPDKLSKALLKIQHRHPLLSTRIIPNGFENPYFEHVPPTGIPLRVIENRENDLLSMEMSKELDHPFNFNNAPLIRCVLIKDNQNPVLLFAVYHAISDGISMTIVMKDILQVLNGKKLQSGKFPLSIDQLVHKETSKIFENKEISHSEKTSLVRRKEPNSKVVLKGLSVELSSKILAKCKEEKTSFQGMLCSAALIAARKAKLPWNSSTIRVIIPISIRDIITNEESSALYINSKALLSEYGCEVDFWELARWAKNELFGVKDLETISHNSIEVRKKLFGNTEPGLLSKNLQKAVVRNMMISNLGRISYEKEGKIRIEHIWGPLALSGTKDEITIGVTTVNDQICLSTATRITELVFMDFLIEELESTSCTAVI